MRVAVVLVVVMTTALAAAKPPVGARAIVDRVVALVGGEPIWKSEIDDTIRAAKAEPSPDVFQRVLDDLIEMHLLLQAAEQDGITATDDEVDTALQQIEQKNSMTDAGLDTALADLGMTRAQYRAELGRQIRIQKLMQREIVPTISVRASESPIEFQMQLETARRNWVLAREKSVHVERRQ